MRAFHGMREMRDARGCREPRACRRCHARRLWPIGSAQCSRMLLVRNSEDVLQHDARYLQ
jgi:hypothetical protein